MVARYSTVADCSALGSEQFGLAGLTSRYQSPVRGDHPPPGQPRGRPQDVAHSAGSPGMTRFNGDLPVGNHLAGPKALDDGGNGVAELRHDRRSTAAW